MDRVEPDRHSINLPEDIYEAYKKDFQMDILTVGNVCSANCTFCSQKWNPPNIIRDLRRFLTVEEIKHFVSAYSNKIGMIASGYHTNSGEFFLHPHAADILEYLAATDKLSVNAEIFSNGMDLTEDHIKIIKALGLNFYLSLNTIDIHIRKNMMGGSFLKNRNALDALDVLEKHNVDYYVWIVPIRSNLVNGDLENTIKYLENSNVKSIQIHRPGYTKLTPPRIVDELNIPDKELLNVILSIKEKYKIEINLVILSPGLKSKNIFQRLTFFFKNAKDLILVKKLFCCAESAKNELPLVLSGMKMPDYDIQIVKSKVFGGNIDCTGLLLVEDYISAIEEYLENSQKEKPAIIILPRGSFDIMMDDLSMVSADKIRSKFNIELAFA